MGGMVQMSGIKHNPQPVPIIVKPEPKLEPPRPPGDYK